MTPKDALVELLTKRGSFSKDLYGIFFDGKLVVASKSRIYIQKGRATTELLNQYFYDITKHIPKIAGESLWDNRKRRVRMGKEIIQELINEGRLEIKKI